MNCYACGQPLFVVRVVVQDASGNEQRVCSSCYRGATVFDWDAVQERIRRNGDDTERRRRGQR